MSTAPVSSSALCPACSKPVDSLRAGQVAILDGAFRYFCDAACKNAYVDTVSKRPALDAMTAEPPPVAASTASVLPVVVVASGVREQPREKEAPFFPPPTADRDHAREEAAASGIRDQDGRSPTAHEDRSSDDVGTTNDRSEPADADDVDAKEARGRESSNDSSRHDNGARASEPTSDSSRHENTTSVSPTLSAIMIPVEPMPVLSSASVPTTLHPAPNRNPAAPKRVPHNPGGTVPSAIASGGTPLITEPTF